MATKTVTKLTPEIRKNLILKRHLTILQNKSYSLTSESIKLTPIQQVMQQIFTNYRCVFWVKDEIPNIPRDTNKVAVFNPIFSVFISAIYPEYRIIEDPAQKMRAYYEIYVKVVEEFSQPYAADFNSTLRYTFDKDKVLAELQNNFTDSATFALTKQDLTNLANEDPYHLRLLSALAVNLNLNIFLIHNTSPDRDNINYSIKLLTGFGDSFNKYKPTVIIYGEHSVETNEMVYYNISFSKIEDVNDSCIIWPKTYAITDYIMVNVKYLLQSEKLIYYFNNKPMTGLPQTNFEGDCDLELLLQTRYSLVVKVHQIVVDSDSDENQRINSEYVDRLLDMEIDVRKRELETLDIVDLRRICKILGIPFGIKDGDKNRMLSVATLCKDILMAKKKQM